MAECIRKCWERGLGVELKHQNVGLTTTALCDLYVFTIKLFFNLVRSFSFLFAALSLHIPSSWSRGEREPPVRTESKR